MATIESGNLENEFSEPPKIRFPDSRVDCGHRPPSETGHGSHNQARKPGQLISAPSENSCSWFAGSIVQYSAADELHYILYDDGEVKLSVKLQQMFDEYKEMLCVYIEDFFV